MKYFAVLTCVLAIAACSSEPDEAELPESTEPTLGEGAAPAEDAPITSLGEEQTAWAVNTSATAGTSLTYFQPVDEPAMRIVCGKNPAELIVEAPQLQKIESEERMTVGVGGRLEAMAVEYEIPAGEAPVARAPLSPEFVASLAGGDFGLSYGADVVEPESAPRDELLSRFARACEAALAAGNAADERELRVGDEAE